MKKEKDKNSIQTSLQELEKLVEWFESQSELDVEQGLAKVRQGAVLIASLKTRLKKVENEFQEIKKELAVEE